MLIETKRSAFDPMKVDLTTKVGASVTYVGEELDFDAKNQMRETNEVLEVFVVTTALAGGTDAPNLQVIVESKETDGSWVQILSGEIIPLASLVADKVLFKSALPDDCGQHVRVSLKNAVAKAFTKGEVVGVIRPL